MCWPFIPPACGPAAVAAVPAKMATAPSGRSARTAHTDVESVAAGRWPGAWRARQASATAATRISIDRQKCAMTKPGARRSRTVKPPSTAWATTPSGRSSPNSARSRRNGRRKKANPDTATASTPTSPENSRLAYSITAWVSSGATSLP